MQSGLMRHRVSFQTQSTTQDGAGQPLDTWVTAYTCWARVETLTGQELLQMQQLVEKVSHRVWIRYPGVSVTLLPQMRILYGTRPFTVVSLLNPEERNEFLQVLAQEIDPSQ